MKRFGVFLWLPVIVVLLTLPTQVQGYVIDYRPGNPPPGYDDSAWPNVTYWFDVLYENETTFDFFNTTATVLATSSDITIVDPNVILGNIPIGGLAWSMDTFSISLDVSTRPATKDYLGLNWRVEFDDSAGVHHVIEPYPEIYPDSVENLPDIAPWTRQTPIPEPTTMLLLGTGLVGLVGFRRKFRK